jgi:hypothetical protein
MGVIKLIMKSLIGEILMSVSMRTVKYFLLTVFGLSATTVFGHHSAAQFDFTQRVPVTGKIKHLDISNPHIDLVLEYENANGNTKQVQFEGHSRNNVFRRGWRPGMMNAGETVTIFIAPMRNGDDGGYIQAWKLADGTEF